MAKTPHHPYRRYTCSNCLRDLVHHESLQPWLEGAYLVCDRISKGRKKWRHFCSQVCIDEFFEKRRRVPIEIVQPLSAERCRPSRD